MEISKIMFALLRFEICGTELSDEVKTSISEEVFAPLYKLSKRHDLAHLVGDALDKNGLLSENSEAKKRFLQERNMAIYRYEQMQYEYKQICETLEKAEIPFIPLKGAVLRQYYPEPWMRTSCDIDILVKEEDLSSAKEKISGDLGYQTDNKRTEHDVSLFSSNGIHLELHYTIEEHVKTMDVVLNQVWDYANSSQLGKSNMFLQDNDFLLFHILSHMAFHILTGGCGIRPFLDVFLLKQKKLVNDTVVKRLCESGGLAKFSTVVDLLIEYWFFNGKSCDLVEELQNYVFFGGVYGVLENRVAVEQARAGTKKMYIIRRIFPPYETMCIRYPTLKKNKILLPLFIVKRWFVFLFSKRKQKTVREIWINANITDDKKGQVLKLMEQLGLS